MAIHRILSVIFLKLFTAKCFLFIHQQTCKKNPSGVNIMLHCPVNVQSFVRKGPITLNVMKKRSDPLLLSLFSCEVFFIIAASVYRSVLSLCVWSTTCSSVTVQETPWRRNATCAASSLVTIGPYVHNNRGTCLHFRSQHISPCHFCTEVTCACHCFPLGNPRTATTGTIWHHGWCRKDNRRCSVMALHALMP